MSNIIYQKAKRMKEGDRFRHKFWSGIFTVEQIVSNNGKCIKVKAKEDGCIYGHLGIKEILPSTIEIGRNNLTKNFITKND